MILFRADLWHSYGVGFGNELNNSMKQQKVLIKTKVRLRVLIKVEARRNILKSIIKL